MAHIRQEIALGLGSGIGHIHGGFQFRFKHFAFGDVVTYGQDFPQAPVFVKDRVIGPGHPHFFTATIAILTFLV